MLGDQDPSYSLICAVLEGRLERVRELVLTYGLSYSQAWSEGYVLLRDAVENKHPEVAKLLLTNGSKVNSKNQTTDTPLHFAATNGDIEIVEMLLDRGANVDAENRDGNTPLHNAVKSNRMEIVQLLVNQGAYVNTRNSYSITPLQLAVEKCSEEIIRLLLQHGAYVNTAINSIYREGYTPLCLAVERGQEKVVQLLLENGANVNAQPKDGKTVLHLAVEKIHEKFVKLLLECGANVNAQDKDGRTVLHFAVEKGQELVVKLLLEFGANVNAQDKDGKTVLHFVEKGHEKIVKLLLEFGANVHAEDKGGKTVLHFAVEKGHERNVKLLLECGANVHAEDKNGNTVLHYAVKNGYSLIVDHVLKHCPDVNNRSNRNALNVAVHGNGKEYGKIIENLLQFGFTVNPEDVNNCELLHAAVEKGYLKIVEEFLKYGTDVNKLYKSTYGKGYMPLHVAARNKQEEVAKLLIRYGADVNAQDESGKTSIFYATENADFRITKLLLTNKANIKCNPELLIIAVKKECREIVEVFLEHGADVNRSDTYGRTALHFTALCNNDQFFGFLPGKDPDINVKGEIAKLLLCCGANVNAQTKKGITTLHVATQQGYVKVVEALLEHNADVNSTIKSDITPLHIAAQKGHLEVVEVLLKFGADTGSQEEYGRTALHIACKEGHEQIVVALLEHGSDINITSKNNCTPLDFAMFGVRSFYNEVNSYDDDDDYYHFYCDRDRGICVCEIIADVLKRHIVKMKTANLYVSKKNLHSISSNAEISDFQNKCEEEIASMKSERVRNANVSFYDILTKDVSQLAVYAGNESIVQNFRSNDYRKKFPIYAGMINSNFRKGERRKELLEQGNKIFHFFFNSLPHLPHDCTEKICSYLSDKDLRIVIDALKPVTVSSPNTDDTVVIT